MTSTLTPAPDRASFAIGNEEAAKRVVDLLTESFDDGEAAIAAFEGPGGRWDVTCISPSRRIKPRSANWSVSPPATTPLRTSPSIPWKPRIGSRRPLKAGPGPRRALRRARRP